MTASPPTPSLTRANRTGDRRSALALLAELAPHVPLAAYLASYQAVRSRRFRSLIVARRRDRSVDYAVLELRVARSDAAERENDALEDSGWRFHTVSSDARTDRWCPYEVWFIDS